MDPNDFLEILRRRFKKQQPDLLNAERGPRIQIADALLDAKQKTFCEYPYRRAKGLCDIVITEKGDYTSATDWIELKPILDGWVYWNYSKFIGERPFMSDITKLRTIKGGKRWFLVVMQSPSEKFEAGPIPKPQRRKRLTPGQVRSEISKWVKSQPKCQGSFEVDAGYCHILLWQV